MKKLFYLVTPLVLTLSFQLSTYADTSTDAALGDTDTAAVVDTGAAPTTSTDSTSLSDVDIGLIAGGSVVAAGLTTTAIVVGVSNTTAKASETAVSDTGDTIDIPTFSPQDQTIAQYLKASDDGASKDTQDALAEIAYANNVVDAAQSSYNAAIGSGNTELASYLEPVLSGLSDG